MLNSFFLEIQTSFIHVLGTKPATQHQRLVHANHPLPHPTKAGLHDDTLMERNCVITERSTEAYVAQTVQCTKSSLGRQPVCNF